MAAARRPAPPSPILTFSSAHCQRLRDLAAELSHEGRDMATAAFLDRLTHDLSRLRASLPADDNERLGSLDANETALLQAFEALGTALADLGPAHRLPLASRTLIDPPGLRALAETLHQAAQAAAECALRAQARAAMLEST